MLESFNGSALDYQKLTPEEMESRGILGRLTGIIADFKNPTRNERYYSSKLWENVFEDPIMQEKIKNRCLFGELGHPEDRLEVDMEKIAICMAEQPKKGKDGKLYGVFDILSTPNGKILKTLCDYGCKVGISSRGNGEVETDFEGREAVVPETYQCECFDVVLVPGVESARLNYVTESLGNKTFKQAINESLKKATPEDRKVMEEALQDLKIDYSDSKGSNNINEKLTSVEDKPMAVNDVKAKMVKQLQEALKENQTLESKITELQEKLSVCYAKEIKQEEELEKYKSTVANLSEKVSANSVLKTKLATLNERVEGLNKLTQQKDKAIKSLSNMKLEMLEDGKKAEKARKTLQEQLETNKKELERAKAQIKSIKEEYQKKEKSLNSEKLELQESISDLEIDAKIKAKEYASKLAKANSLTEKYKSVAKQAVDKYITSQALRLGIDSNTVRDRLPENYSFADIDRVCEQLSDYNLQVSNLPFSVSSKAKIEMKTNRVNEDLDISSDNDSCVDEFTLRLAGLKKQ